MPILDPHQGHVAVFVSVLSLVVTLGLLAFMFRDEKKHQDTNHDDH